MTRIFLFPGMGASSAMYASVKRQMRSINTVDWCNHVGCNSMTEYANRCIDTYGIESNDIVGGSSFGGMIAAETANLIKSKLVVLIGSCLLPESISPIFFNMAPLGSIIPYGSMIKLIGSVPASSVNVADMICDNPQFIRWAFSALRKWKGVKLQFKVAHIHGGRDIVIPVRRVDADIVIPNGGHLLAISHPFHVSAFLQTKTAAA